MLHVSKGTGQVSTMHIKKTNKQKNLLYMPRKEKSGHLGPKPDFVGKSLPWMTSAIPGTWSAGGEIGNLFKYTWTGGGGIKNKKEKDELG